MYGDGGLCRQLVDGHHGGGLRRTGQQRRAATHAYRTRGVRRPGRGGQADPSPPLDTGDQRRARPLRSRREPAPEKRAVLTRPAAVVLSGGGAKTAAHLGACRALKEAGFEPTWYVATSMGAVIAAGVGRGGGDDEAPGGKGGGGAPGGGGGGGGGVGGP